MSSRRVVVAKAAGNAVRHKPSIVNTNVHARPVKAKVERNDDDNGSFAWWRETAGQLSPILSVISLLGLYGITFYLPFLTHQSVQFVVCCFLLAISILNFSHYFTAKEVKKVTNMTALLAMATLPRNVKKNFDGTYSITVWRPSAFTEAIFLTYNPLIPVLAYIWVRSFEPFSSWACVALMFLSAALLHLMSAKFRIQVNNELLLLQTGPEARNLKMDPDAGYGDRFENLDGPVNVDEHKQGRSGRYAQEAGGFEYNQIPSPKSFDGPANAIFQVSPDALISKVDPINSHPSHSPESAFQPRVQEPIFMDAHQAHSPYLPQSQHNWDHPQRNYMMDANAGYEVPIGSPISARLSPSHERAQPQTPGSRAHQIANANNIFHQVPTTPQPRSFGLRFGASSAIAPSSAGLELHDAPPPVQSIYEVSEDQAPSRHKVLVTEDDSFGPSPPRYPEIPDQSPPKILSPGRHHPYSNAVPGHTPLRFGASATPSKPQFGAPPRFSMQDFDQ